MTLCNISPGESTEMAVFSHRTLKLLCLGRATRASRQVLMVRRIISWYVVQSLCARPITLSGIGAVVVATQLGPHPLSGVRWPCDTRSSGRMRRRNPVGIVCGLKINVADSRDSIMR